MKADIRTTGKQVLVLHRDNTLDHGNLYIFGQKESHCDVTVTYSPDIGTYDISRSQK